MVLINCHFYIINVDPYMINYSKYRLVKSNVVYKNKIVYDLVKIENEFTLTKLYNYMTIFF